MNNNLTEIIAILDRSGSMDHLTGDTIGGYNSFIKGQQDGEGEAVLTTVLFDDKYELLHDRVDVKKVKPITRKEYFARGTTALLDALGKTLRDVGAKLHNTAEAERPGKVIVFIITDGEENASVEYTKEKVKEMVELQRTTYGWEFIFIGANIDSFSTAGSLGIDTGNAFTIDADGDSTARAHFAMRKIVSNYRKSGDIRKGESWEDDLK
ncbi:hypothetical protein FACS1894147_11510 [Spirochaetia bacterium]|nr:hypothetical protein FACS1894147_11510 [Spirochaetia bacterium]